MNNLNINNNLNKYIYSDEEKERIKTEIKLNNPNDIHTYNKNLEKKLFFFHESTKNMGLGMTNRTFMNDSDFPMGSGYYSEADQKKEKVQF